jgi:transcriptional regulator with XRE-family HTH domain
MSTSATYARQNRGILKTIGVQIRRHRAEAGKTQQDLADRCDIYRTYLSRIESGTVNPTVTVLAALASALKVPVSELFKD